MNELKRRGRPPKTPRAEEQPAFLDDTKSPEELWLDGYYQGQRDTIDEIGRMMSDDKDDIIRRMND